MNVLIVEDEKSLASEIADFLRSENFLCDVAFTGKDAFTGKEFRLENDKRESNVPDDLTMASIGGRVQPAP